MSSNSQSARRWLEHGASLVAAAKFLFKSLAKDRSLPSEPHRVLELGQLRGAMTLLGAGLECMLKARAISDGIIDTEPASGKTQLSRPWSSHDLRAMAEALSLPVSPDDLLVLEKASHGVRWLGRYPDPKTRAELEVAVEIGAQKLSTGDFEAAGRIQLAIQNSIRD